MSKGKGHRGHKEVKKQPAAKTVLVATDARFTGIAKANTYIGKIGKMDAFFRSAKEQGNCGCCGRPVSTEVYASPDYRDESCPNRRCQGVVIKQLQQKYADALASLKGGSLKPVAQFEQMPYQAPPANRQIGYGAGQYAGL